MIVKLSLLTLSHMRVHARVCGRYFVYSWHVASCARAGQSRSTVWAESGESGRSSGTSRRRSRQGKVVVGTDTVFFCILSLLSKVALPMFLVHARQCSAYSSEAVTPVSCCPSQRRLRSSDDTKSHHTTSTNYVNLAAFYFLPWNFFCCFAVITTPLRICDVIFCYPLAFSRCQWAHQCPCKGNTHCLKCHRHHRHHYICSET